ncbi:Beta-1,4-galactosyltransferase 7 [Melipona quadrifasciata]|uniref:Beta-1,4-galactosyltransferase 7 n=1 Tax=Melipona quadrifasciata TaxID=166423 RepID=A0A0M9A456_9HYME|nr:Beta-1,4-galactosyltransferase 7 [Melipona quadrifasciata]
MEVVWKNIKFKYIFACILITFIISCLISIAPISIDECKCEIATQSSQYNNNKQQNNDNKVYKKSLHHLAILVPFRDRFEELLIFAPHMKKFLDKQNIDYHIFVLNQVDRFRFNRASLINVGFLEIDKEFDYIAIHDYHYPTFVGGILLIKREHFMQVNGMSNKYWGWGLEDDEFYVRLKEAGLSVMRPQNISTGTHNTFKHIHDRNHRKRDMIKCYNQREVTRKRDRQTGLNNVSYKILGTVTMTIGDTPLTVLNISLMCDKMTTPWCECDKIVGSKDGKSKEKKKVNNSKSATGL